LIKFFLIIFFFLSSIVYSKAPFNEKNIKFIFELEEKKIYVVYSERSEIIFEFDEKNKQFKELNRIYWFEAFAENCKTSTGKVQKNVILGRLQMISMNKGVANGIYESELLSFNLYQKENFHKSNLGKFNSVDDFENSCKILEPIFNNR
jgi:hypothetical protein